LKLEKWALVAEIIGGAAIVISLMVLVFEVRGNTAAIEAQTATTWLESERGRRYPLIVNEGGLTELVLKRVRGGTLTEVERMQVARYFTDEIRTYEWLFREVQAGRLPAERLNLRAWQEFSGRLQVTFEDIRNTLDPGFVEYWEENVVGH